jgi:ACS family tartrate transporter-like MFS transporter
VLAWLLCAFGLGIAALARSSTLELMGLTLAVVGIFTAISQLMTLPSSFLRGPASAGAIGMINTVVSLGGVVAPPVIGLLKEETGSYAPAMAMIAGGLFLSSSLVLALRRSLSPRLAFSPAENVA